MFDLLDSLRDEGAKSRWFEPSILTATRNITVKGRGTTECWEERTKQIIISKSRKNEDGFVLRIAMIWVVKTDCNRKILCTLKGRRTTEFDWEGRMRQNGTNKSRKNEDGYEWRKLAWIAKR